MPSSVVHPVFRVAGDGPWPRGFPHAGELDGGPRTRVAAEIAGLFANAEMVVQPRAGHYPWLDDPGRFARTVTGFLDMPFG